jgi:hypothetical protein
MATKNGITTATIGSVMGPRSQRLEEKCIKSLIVGDMYAKLKVQIKPTINEDMKIRLSISE